MFELADSLSDAIVAATRLAEEFRGASDVMCITERDRWVVARVISRSSCAESAPYAPSWDQVDQVDRPRAEA